MCCCVLSPSLTSCCSGARPLAALSLPASACPLVCRARARTSLSLTLSASLCAPLSLSLLSLPLSPCAGNIIGAMATAAAALEPDQRTGEQQSLIASRSSGGEC